ncbi:MAG: hypothetical protein ACYTFT_00330 [Planctomycetota bacterium]
MTGATTRKDLPARSGFAQRFKAGLANAFSLAPADGPMTDKDFALLDEVAAAVKKRGMASAAMLWLESVKPLHFVGSQALHALRPFAQLVVSGEKYTRLAKVFERRDGIEELLKRIEAPSGQAAESQGLAGSK